MTTGGGRTQERAEGWSRLIDAVRGTYGYLTVQQLRELDFGRNRVDHLAATGSLVSVSHGVYRLPGQTTTWRSKLFLFTLETRSAASHLSAAILCRVGSRRDSYPGYREATTVHRSRRLATQAARRLYLVRGLDTSQHVRVDGIPCTSIHRTLLDVASRHSLERFTACFNEAVRRGLTTFDRLVQAYEVEPVRRSGAPAIRAAIAAVDGQVVPMSDWSRWATDRLVAGGLPGPELEAVLRDPRGNRIAQVDLYWADHGLVVELDSRQYHFDSRAFARDRRRDALLAGVGITVIRITWEQYQDGSYFVDVVGSALSQRDPKA